MERHENHGHGWRGGSGHRGGRGGRPGGRGGWQQSDLPTADDASAWFAGRLPDDWFQGAPQVDVDRDEIVVVGTLAPVEAVPAESGEPTAEATAAAAAGRAARFREDTREQRIGIAEQAQARYGRRVAWGVQVGDERFLYSTSAVPVMTRLRQPDRQVLDTLVDAGVARSRSDALVWCVRLVGQHADGWLDELRAAMSSVDEVRTRGPGV
ncbi:MAG: hypothetical protein ACR2FF_02730 [Mycobacteriales bacterium]|nr:MAG: hypothetical protein DLM56_13895 [Pseudonocardiales bacterium]